MLAGFDDILNNAVGSTLNGDDLVNMIMSDMTDEEIDFIAEMGRQLMENFIEL